MSDNRSSTGRTIGVIVGAVVLVGALGGVASAAFGGDSELDSPQPHATGLGVETATPTRQSGAGSGSGSGGAVRPSAVPSAVPSAFPTSFPTSLPSSTDPTDPADPAEPSGFASPSEEPTDAASPESSGPAAFEPGKDNTETIGDGVLVNRPSGWSVDSHDDTHLAMSSGDGSWAYALTGVTAPSTEASAVLSDNLDDLLAGDNYSQTRFSQVAPLAPYGSLVSVAEIDYQTLWVDPQTAIPLYGQAYAAIRQDGTALVIIVEHTPPDGFAGELDVLAPIVNNTVTLFGGS